MEGARSIMFSKLPSALARTNSRQFVVRSPGRIRCNQFYFRQDVFCVLSSQTFLEMGELYNYIDVSYTTLREGGGSYNLHYPFR